MKPNYYFTLTIAFLLVFGQFTNAQLGKNALETVAVGEVESAFPAPFCMKTYKGNQYIAYYDADHNMVMAKRALGSSKWQKTILPTKVGWDSHNYVTFAFDKEGYLHLSGNMHNVPLIYFRSKKPESIDELEPINSMIGKEEIKVTYPLFMTNSEGDLIFHYRSGSSGNGYEVYNQYDCKTKTWKRLLDMPLIDGKGHRNAYMQGPTMGKDGFYHLIWVWRENGDCSTNHTLSYARSRDLLHWESIRGEKVPLPITLENKELVVDSTQVKGGLFNPGIRFSLDSNKQPLIGYHKYDKDGNNQLYLTRFENGSWKQVQLTNWKYRWQFEGGGSMKNELSISSPVIVDKNIMAFGYDHIKYGNGQVLFDQTTLQPKGVRDTPPVYPNEYNKIQSDFPTMTVNTLVDGSYLLRWETLPANRDRKPQGELPPPSKLMVYKFK